MTTVTITIPTTDPVIAKQFTESVEHLAKELTPKGVVKLRQIYDKEPLTKAMVKQKVK